MRRPGAIRPYPDQGDVYQDDVYENEVYQDDVYDEGVYQDDVYETTPKRRKQKDADKTSRRNSVDSWMDQDATFLPGVKRRKIALVLAALPAILPWIFTLRGWISLNEKLSLTNTEADSLGTGGEYCFLLCVSITPLITLTGQRWFAPLRRWYGVMFALIGLSDSVTASIVGAFSGGPIGRIAGHSFLLAGLIVILLALPVVITSNKRMQVALGRYWKRVQKVTYLIWAMIIIHLALLDGFRPFDGPQGDGDPVFHQRLYQILAVSFPLVILRLPPVKRWIAEQRAAGQQWKVWFAIMPMAALYIAAMAFMFNEEIFTGTKIITMNPPGN